MVLARLTGLSVLWGDREIIMKSFIFFISFFFIFSVQSYAAKFCSEGEALSACSHNFSVCETQEGDGNCDMATIARECYISCDVYIPRGSVPFYAAQGRTCDDSCPNDSYVAYGCSPCRELPEYEGYTPPEDDEDDEDDEGYTPPEDDEDDEDDEEYPDEYMCSGTPAYNTFVDRGASPSIVYAMKKCWYAYSSPGLGIIYFPNTVYITNRNLPEHDECCLSWAEHDCATLTECAEAEERDDGEGEEEEEAEDSSELSLWENKMREVNESVIGDLRRAGEEPWFDSDSDFSDSDLSVPGWFTNLFNGIILWYKGTFVSKFFSSPHMGIESVDCSPFVIEIGFDYDYIDFCEYEDELSRVGDYLFFFAHIMFFLIIFK